MARRPGPWLRRLFRLPNYLYDHKLGWLLGHRLLRLTHTGRRSGKEYHTVLEVVHADRASGAVTVVAGFGRRTDWYRNITAHPAVAVEVGRRRFRPVHRELSETEACAVIAAYEHRMRFIRPLVHKGLSWLVGWSYDGSDDARRRLVRQLPVITFTPAE